MGKNSGRKRKKRKPSTDAQKKLNQRHREEKLARLLHANFTPEGLEIHLTYRVQPENDEEAKRHLQNFIRRLKRYIAKHGLGKRGCRYQLHVTIEVE